MKYNFIKTELKQHIFTITLARPAKRNAFTPTMVNEIDHAIHIANADDAVKVVVFNAEGPTFCAGMDLKTFQDPSLDTFNPEVTNKTISLGEVMEQLIKPSVAIVEGDVIAGAFLLIANCTYVYCKREVRFRLPELEIGIYPFQVMASLLKIMPEKTMLQLCLQTDYFAAAEAEKVGLVDGYLEETDSEQLLSNFAKFNTLAITAGISAAKQLPKVKTEERYRFLLAALEDLKEATKEASS